MTGDRRTSDPRILICLWLVLAGLLACAPAHGEGPAIDQTASLAGQFLVAEDSMTDPRFAQSVVYMVRHDHQGAMGMVINRPLGELPLRELLRVPGGDPEGVTGSTLVHAGGPVEPQLGFVIHTAERLYKKSLRVGERIAVTSQPEILRAIGRGDPPRRHRGKYNGGSSPDCRFYPGGHRQLYPL